MRYALILDTETTGLDPGEDFVVEVACMLFDLQHASPVASFASLIVSERNPAWEINRIYPSMLRVAPEPIKVWPDVIDMASRADVILAHRAEFDRGFVPPELRTIRPWVCTKYHVEWPHGKAGDHLVHLALAHGVGIVTAHRAMADVDTIARLLTRVYDDKVSEEDPDPLSRMIAWAMRPRRKVRAIVSYADRDVAKQHGFAWYPESKSWLAELPEDKLAALPFKVSDAQA